MFTIFSHVTRITLPKLVLLDRLLLEVFCLYFFQIKFTAFMTYNELHYHAY